MYTGNGTYKYEQAFVIYIQIVLSTGTYISADISVFVTSYW